MSATPEPAAQPAPAQPARAEPAPAQRSRLRRWVARLNPLLVVMVLTYAFVATFLVIPRITADGLLYLAESRSVVFDGDRDLDDEYRFDPDLSGLRTNEGRREFLPRDPDGRFIASANEGIVVLFAPLLLVGHAVSGALAAAGGSVSMDGYDMPYLVALAFGTNALVALGLFLVARFASSLVGWRSAALGAVAIWLGSSLVHWSLFRPAHAHAPAVLIESIFVVLFFARARYPSDRVAWLAMGIAWGFLVSIRPLGGLYAAVPAAWLAYCLARSVLADARADTGHGRLGSVAAALPAGLAAVLPAGLAFLAGGLIGRLPQIVMTGEFTLLGSSYYEQTGFLEGADGDPVVGFLSLVLDPRQGLIVWVPVVCLAIVGLAAYWRRDRLVTVAGLAWIALVMVYVGTLGYPERFGGPTFSSRHLVELTPIMVLGAAGVPSLFASLWPRRRRAMSIVGGAVIVLAAAWGTIEYALTEAVVRAVNLAPIPRFLHYLANPNDLGRLLYAEDRPGPVYLAGRLIAWVRGLASGVDVLVGLVLLGIFAGAVAVLAGPLWRLVSGERARAGPAGDDETGPPAGGQPPGGTNERRRRWSHRLGWVVVAGVVAATLVSFGLRPRIPSDGATRVAETWIADGPTPPAGDLSSITIGRTLYGNRVITPPPAAPGEPGGSGTGEAVGRASTQPGLEGVITTDPTWYALAGLVVQLDGAQMSQRGADVEAWVARDGQPVAVVSRTMVFDAATNETTITLPLGLRPGSAESLHVGVRYVGTGDPPTAGVTADGSLAVRPLGVPAVRPPGIQRDGEPLTGEAWQAAPMFEQTSLVVRPNRRPVMRVGPWGPELMLRSASSAATWHIPGPSPVPGSWTDSMTGAPDAARLDITLTSPWPMRAVTAQVMVTSLDRAQAASVLLSGTTDGVTFQRITEMRPRAVSYQQLAIGTYVPPAGTTVATIRLEIVGGPALAVNGAWFDIETERQNALFDAGGGAIGVAAGTGPVAPAEFVIARRPSAVEAVAFAAADGLAAVVRGTSWAMFALIGAALAVAAVVLTLRGRPGVAGGLALVGALSLGLAVAGLPRQVELPRTQTFGAGVPFLAEVSPGTVTSRAAGANYRSPLVSVPVGGIVRDVRLKGDVAGALVEIRPISTTGSAGAWQPADEPLASFGDGVQARVTFSEPGQVLTGIELVIDPPIGR
jgi:hypothetical protein